MSLIDTRTPDPKRFIAGTTGDWEIVIGLEVHAQVTSEAKLFSGASTAFGAAPNANVSLVDAAMPGMLPVINEECVRQAIRTGIAIGAKESINLRSIFDRKNYFYPDLPQGYQISQYKQPIVGEGVVSVLVGPDRQGGFEKIYVGVERLHLEQDAGKSIHDQHPTVSYVDLNRSGVALMEIVSKPEMYSAEQAKAYLSKLRSLLRWYGTCDGNMDEGSMRADVNVSVRRAGDEKLGTRCEIKNVNSIRFVGLAIEYEARRQIAILEDGGSIKQETRLFDASKGETRSMRSKEEAHDYRYFPDPDLLPLEFTQTYVDALEADMREHPDVTSARFISVYGLSSYNATVLTTESVRADYFEVMIQKGAEPKAAANWLINEYLGRSHGSGQIESEATEPGPRSVTVNVEGNSITASLGNSSVVLGPVSAEANSAIVQMTTSGAISGKMAKDLLSDIWVSNTSPTLVEKINSKSQVELYAKQLGYEQVTDTGAIEKAVDEIIAANPEKVEQAKAKPTLAGWFVGQVMKATGGKANPQAVNDLVKAKLGIE